MESLLEVAQQVAILFVLMGVGAALRRLRMLDDAAVGGMVGAGIMILSSVISWLARVVPVTVRSLLSSEGFALGVILGLVWYFRTHKRNTEAKEEEKNSGTVDGAKVETEIVEAPAYRTFNA